MVESSPGKSFDNRANVGPHIARGKRWLHGERVPVQLNHTIVHAVDARAAAVYLAEILGLRAPRPFSHFWIVETDNDVSLDFLGTDEEIQIQHYAFLVSEQEFDEIFGRIQQRKLPYWADPAGRLEGQINRNDGGRGVYFRDLSGHYLEILTRPYGSGSGSET